MTGIWITFNLATLLETRLFISAKPAPVVIRQASRCFNISFAAVSEIYQHQRNRNE